MMMRKIYLLCGPSGCGKSTWATEQKQNDCGFIVSRDRIRFSMLKENEDYFAHEKKVFESFYKSIRNILKKYPELNLYIDATHLNKASRNKIVNKFKDLLTDNDNLIAVCFETEYYKAIENNDKRTSRAFVPEDVIYDQYHNYKHPDLEEEPFIDEVWKLHITKKEKSND